MCHLKERNVKENNVLEIGKKKFSSKRKIKAIKSK